MWLMIDAGNTRIKWATSDPDQIQQTKQIGQFAQFGSLASDDARGLAREWKELSRHQFSNVIISNVAGIARSQAIEAALDQYAPQAERIWFASSTCVAGLHNDYRNPAQLGCDRFASAIGARCLFPGRPLVVATCGTATTVDAVSPDAHFLGGMILPGLALMARSLYGNTAQLPVVGTEVQLTASFADNTQDAIIAGCVTAQAGAIVRAVGDMQARFNKQPVQLLVSGGAGRMLAPFLPVDHQVVDNLVLVGLQSVMLASC